MKGTVHPSSKSLIAASTCFSATAISFAITLLIFITALYIIITKQPHKDSNLKMTESETVALPFGYGGIKLIYYNVKLSFSQIKLAI